MKTITQTEAARLKYTTKHAVATAIKSGRLNTVPHPRISRIRLVCEDDKFHNWTPGKAGRPKKPNYQTVDKVLPPDLILQADAARLKGCSRQAVGDAIKRGRLNIRAHSGKWAICRDEMFQKWLAGERADHASPVVETLRQAEAARIKGCDAYTIKKAIEYRQLNTVPHPRMPALLLVSNDDAFRSWNPTPANAVRCAVAARMKNCREQTIVNALQAGRINSMQERGTVWVVLDAAFEAFQPLASRPPKGSISKSEAARLKKCNVTNVIAAIKAGHINKVVGDNGLEYVQRDAALDAWLSRKRGSKQTEDMPEGVLSQKRASEIKKCTATAILYALRTRRLNGVMVGGRLRVKDDAVFKAWQPVTVTGRKRNKSGQYVKTARAKKSDTAKAKK